MPNIDDFFLIADNAGIRLEIIDGLPIWEALPNLTHQETIDRIRQMIGVSDRSNGSCACLHYAGLHIKFPDGSDKRSDISIFCQEPSETEFAVTEVPEAVIEIISKGYEKKDLELGPPFYLEQGVRDVIVYNPLYSESSPLRRHGRQRLPIAGHADLAVWLSGHTLNNATKPK